MLLSANSVSYINYLVLYLGIIGCASIITHNHWIKTNNIPSNYPLNIYHILQSKSTGDCALCCQQYQQCVGFTLYKENGTKSCYLLGSDPGDNLVPWNGDSKVFIFSGAQRCLEKGYIIHNNLNICIKKSDVKMDWWAGRNVCLADGGDLISVNTQAKVDLFNQNYFTNGWSRVFLGGMDELEWTWVDGTAVDSSIWADGQPDSVNEKCMEFKDTNKANDKECTAELHFVCEINFTN